MASANEITVAQFQRLVGLPDAPQIVDVRIDEHFAADPRMIPGSGRRDYRTVTEWAPEYAGRRVVVLCQLGLKLSQGAAAWLRASGANAEALAGGFEAYRDAGGLLYDSRRLPPHDALGRTLWVTRARPKVDRIACPWLIRRFIDASAVFLFVTPSDVADVADRFGATPFDIEGVHWSHRGERCTFDTMLDEFGLRSSALDRLATIVRGADTERHDLAPEAAGLLAASVGYSRMYRDDLEQLAAAMSLYDAFYRRCRDAGEETHDWPSPGSAT